MKTIKHTLKQLINNDQDGNAVVYFSLNEEQYDGKGQLSAAIKPDAFMAYDSKTGTVVIKAEKIVFATNDLTVEKLGKK